jgi:ATP-binding cassette subfamily B protein
MHQPLLILFKRLWAHISPRRRTQFLLLLILTIVCSFAEVLTLGAVIPFISILTQPDIVFNYPFIGEIINQLVIKTGAELSLILTIGFIIAAIIAGSLRLVLLWTSIRLGNAMGSDLSVDLFRRTLYQDYSIHISRNSSEIVSAIVLKVTITTSVMIALVAIITSSIIFIAIMGTILIIEPIVATIGIFVFGSAYGLVGWIYRNRLKSNSCIIADEQTQVIKVLKEGLGSIRDVLLNGSQTLYCNLFSKSIFKLLKTEGENAFILQSPRYFIESLGIVLIVFYALYLSAQTGGIIAALPFLAVLAIGIQRLLPLMQQIYSQWAEIISSQVAFSEVLSLLNQPLPIELTLSPKVPIILKHDITFKNISFKYTEESNLILDNINFKIDKGDRVGFIGKTGSGKSTTLDLLMGMINPTKGQILVDGLPVLQDQKRAWQAAIATVPQNIFITDTTIAENIAFGVPLDEIDFKRVEIVSKQANISKYIESMPLRYSSMIGERGVRLSGGQKQRIGIARALYKNASVLIFDEGTSALDNETEKAVMSSIEGLSKSLTIIIIAHRLTTLKNCNKTIEISDGRIKNVI